MIALRILQRPDNAAGADPGLLPVGPAGATIGRASDCDIVLDDPMRLVSRRHAWIAAEGRGQALLRCLSTSSPLTVNHERLAANQERLVRPGDRLRIGGFELVVEPLGLPEAPRTETLAATVVATPQHRQPPAQPPAQAAMAPAAPRPARLDRWFDLDTVPDPLGPESPLPALADASAAHPRPAAGHGAARTGTAPDPAAMDPDYPPTLLMRRPPAAADPAPAAAAELQVLQQAFLHGAGLDPARTPFTLDATMMAHLGALLRAQTEGTLELLRARALTKRNLRAKGTGITPRENNLLKFAPDTAEAVKQLLEPAGRAGFLPPLDAVRAANHDLQVHQLAMAAGMRAAMLDLITQLGPEAIAASADPPQGAARMMPALREAQLWQRLQQAHRRLVEHLDDTFDSAFGREFVRAYEAYAAQARTDQAADGDAAARH